MAHKLVLPKVYTCICTIYLGVLLKSLILGANLKISTRKSWQDQV
ncbi:hypothetical protein AO385_0524 [Moraxella catarrhalis]|uniref:Uncharacterized protein n=1 Tax=Moraxella catarrhalis TaxID=480 RepID=A0A198UXP2_MORCA|nr:hypothetical protein AO383_1240 [Moraxella catarrhalis]OAU98497.1 hypothetical protein AO384_0081 [Moraxella catarrhalis]OAV00985.1 hypothetical protein AO382_1103 [Moraxella catarrhalis]OAV03446.1 hypothetical protein AO385_0524 [Moraxella catarrhalis]